MSNRKFTDEQEERLVYTLGSMAAMAHVLHECGGNPDRHNMADFITLMRQQIIDATDLHYLQP